MGRLGLQNTFPNEKIFERFARPAPVLTSSTEPLPIYLRSGTEERIKPVGLKSFSVNKASAARQQCYVQFLLSVVSIVGF